MKGGDREPNQPSKLKSVPARWKYIAIAILKEIIQRSLKVQIPSFQMLKNDANYFECPAKQNS